MSDIDSRTFTIINFISALIWSIAVTALGWWAGPTVGAKLGQWFDWHDAAIVGGGAIAMLLIVHAWRRMESKAE